MPKTRRVLTKRTHVKASSRQKPHICFDMLPTSEDELIAWADQAIEINPQNQPAPVVQVAMALSGDVSRLPAMNPTRAEMALLTTKKWQAGQEITFGFIRASQQIASHARNAVVELAKYANLKFRETTAAQAMVRIHDAEEGAYAYIGTDALGIPRNQKTMNLARSWADLATAIHEWCHALGMIHEHQSPAAPEDLWNVEAVYRAYSGPPNNWTREMIKSNVLDRYSRTNTNHTEWDRKSIMLYPMQAELLKNPAYATGWNKQLSETDKKFLGQTYPFADQPPPPPPTGDDITFTVPRAGTYRLVIP